MAGTGGSLSGTPFPSYEEFVTDGRDGHVSAAAGAAFYRPSPPAVSASAITYFVAGPLGGYQACCRRRNPARIYGKRRFGRVRLSADHAIVRLRVWTKRRRHAAS